MIEGLAQLALAPERVVQMHRAAARQHEDVADALVHEDVGDEIGDAHLGHGCY